ncbi:MAG: lipopolysaccharide biosynthesis protein [Phycisphaerae bacterium]
MAETQPNSEGFRMSRVWRLGKYASWYAADQFLTLGVTRLVLFPILAAFLGDAKFGGFVLALGLAQMVGNAPSNGLAGYILRDAAHQSERDQHLMMRTMLVLAALGVLPFVLVLALGAPAIASIYGQETFRLLLPCFGVFLLFQNLTETCLAIHRVRRNFHVTALVHGLQTLLLFGAIPLSLAGGTVGAGYAYVLASAGTFGVLFYGHRQGYIQRPVFSGRFAKSAVVVWWPLSLSAFVFLSSRYLDRPLLGFWWPPQAVTAFFAAVSTSAIFAMPGSLISGLVLSLLGKIRSRDAFSRSFHLRYAAGVWLFVAMLFAMGAPLGQTILGILYPGALERAAPLWGFAVGAAALQNAVTLCRPFIVKFLSPRLIPVLAVISVVARVVPLLVLVPTGGERGAAVALLIGSSVMAVAWFLTYALAFILHRPGTPVESRGECEPVS